MCKIIDMNYFTVRFFFFSPVKVKVKLPVYAGGVHGVQSHVEHLCGLGQLTSRC